MNYLTYLPVWAKLTPSQQDALTTSASLSHLQQKRGAAQWLRRLYRTILSVIRPASRVHNIRRRQRNYIIPPV